MPLSDQTLTALSIGSLPALTEISLALTQPLDTLPRLEWLPRDCVVLVGYGGPLEPKLLTYARERDARGLSLWRLRKGEVSLHRAVFEELGERRWGFESEDEQTAPVWGEEPEIEDEGWAEDFDLEEEDPSKDDGEFGLEDEGQYGDDDLV